MMQIRRFMSKVDSKKIPEHLDKRKKLMDWQKEEIRLLIDKGFSDVDLAEEYEVSRTTIYMIRKPLKYAECLENNKRNNKKMGKRERKLYMADLRQRKIEL